MKWPVRHQSVPYQPAPATVATVAVAKASRLSRDEVTMFGGRNVVVRSNIVLVIVTSLRPANLLVIPGKMDHSIIDRNWAKVKSSFAKNGNCLVVHPLSYCNVWHGGDTGAGLGAVPPF